MPKRTHDGLLKRCKCGEKKWLRCTHSWVVRFFHDDREHFVTLNKVADWPKGQPMSKAEAVRLRDQVRDEIRRGVGAGSASAAALTVGDVMAAYEAEFVNVSTRRSHARESMAGHLRMARTLMLGGSGRPAVRFVDLAAKDVRASDVEGLRHARRQQLAAADAAYAEVVRLTDAGLSVPADLRQRSRLRTRGKGGEVGINRMLARLRHMFSWAITRYPEIEHHPFKKGGISVVKLVKEDARSRRLREGELTALMDAAPPHLQRLIVAALNTGCRIGELLSLQWHQVERDAAGLPCRLRLVGEKTKTSRTRVLPVSEALREVLLSVECAPDGRRHDGGAFVFGNEVGEKVERVQTAWETACRRSGIEGLHFHDLRREFGSRLLDGGVPLTTIQHYLGHTSVTTTAKYLQADQQLIATAVEAVERGWSGYGIRTSFGLSGKKAS